MMNMNMKMTFKTFGAVLAATCAADQLSFGSFGSPGAVMQVEDGPVMNFDSNASVVGAVRMRSAEVIAPINEVKSPQSPVAVAPVNDLGGQQVQEVQQQTRQQQHVDGNRQANNQQDDAHKDHDDTISKFFGVTCVLGGLFLIFFGGREAKDCCGQVVCAVFAVASIVLGICFYSGQFRIGKGSS